MYPNEEIVKYNFKVVSKELCETTYPLECPSCQGHFCMDATYIEQVEPVSCVCPVCNFRANIPNDL